MSKAAVIYYSRKGENYWNGSIKTLAKGNTEVVAEMIAQIEDADLFEVETCRPYAADYHECTQEALKELREQARPQLKRYLNDLTGHDPIYVGFSNWWGTMPMAMFSCLEQADLRGKRILPFCTNEGSGMGSSEQDLRKICKGATVEKGLSIRGTQAANSRKQVEAWIKERKTQADR